MGRKCSLQQPNQQHPAQNAAHSEKAQLAVGQLKNLLEHAAPAGRGDKRKKTLDHQNEGQRQPECVKRHTDFYFRDEAGDALPRKVSKNSDDEGSTTMMSLFLPKLVR